MAPTVFSRFFNWLISKRTLEKTTQSSDFEETATDLIISIVEQSSADRETIARYIEFETSTGQNALDRLAELYKAHQNGKRYPIILGDRCSKTELSQTVIRTSKTLDRSLHAAKETDPEGFFNQQRDFFSPLDDVLGQWTEKDVRKGGIPGTYQIYIHAIHNIYTHKPRPKVDFALLAIEGSWHVPLIIDFGGWNAAPGPIEQCAIHRAWNKRYKSRIVAIDGPTIECLVEEPPRARADAERLAMEQYLYCPDIVEQGTGTIAGLAQVLINEETWFFWWD